MRPRITPEVIDLDSLDLLRAEREYLAAVSAGERTVAEIAEAIGCTEATTRALLARHGIEADK